MTDTKKDPRYPWVMARLTGKQCTVTGNNGHTLYTLKPGSLHGVDIAEAAAFLARVFGEENVVAESGISVREAGLAAFCRKHGTNVPPDLIGAGQPLFTDQEENERLRREVIEPWERDAARMQEAARNFNPDDLFDDDEFPLGGDSGEFPISSSSGVSAETRFEHVHFHQQVLGGLTGSDWTLARFSTPEGTAVDGFKLALPEAMPKHEKERRRAMAREVTKRHAVEIKDELYLPDDALAYYAPRAENHKALRELTGRHWKHSRLTQGGATEDAYTPLFTSDDDGDARQRVLDTLRASLPEGVYATAKGIVVSQKAVEHYRHMLELGERLSRMTGKPWKHILRRNQDRQKKDAFLLDLPEGHVLENREKAMEALKDALKMDVFDAHRGGKADGIVVWAEAMEEYAQKHKRTAGFDPFGLDKDAMLAALFRDVPASVEHERPIIRRWTGDDGQPRPQRPHPRISTVEGTGKLAM